MGRWFWWGVRKLLAAGAAGSFKEVFLFGGSTVILFGCLDVLQIGRLGEFLFLSF